MARAIEWAARAVVFIFRVFIKFDTCSPSVVVQPFMRTGRANVVTTILAITQPSRMKPNQGMPAPRTPGLPLFFNPKHFCCPQETKLGIEFASKKFPDGNMSLAEQEPHAAARQMTRTGNCQLVLSAKFRHHRQMTFGPTAKNRPHNCRASLQADANAANKYYHFSSISDSFNYSQRMTDFTPISLIHEHKHN